MSQNDYIILRDEDGKAYIAHAGWLDNAKNAVTNAAQQVANKAKGVGRGVRQNHKYILKVFENGKTRYFYKQEEVKAYYEAKKRGVKNAAEYAQNAVKDKASDVADAAKNVASKAGDAARSAFREATGQAARDRMDASAANYSERANSYNKANDDYKKATSDRNQARDKYVNAMAEREKAEQLANNSNIFNRKARQVNVEAAKAQEAQYKQSFNKAEQNRKDAQNKRNAAALDYGFGDLTYQLNKRQYDRSLAGAVDRTAARARETAANAKDTASSAFNRAKDAANNTVSNAKNAYERMKGEFRDRAEQAGNAVKSTAKNAVDKAKDIAGYDEKERFDKAAENKQNTKDAARKGEQYVTDVLNESNPLHRTQTEVQRLNAAVGIRNERWNAEDKARAEYLRARDAYNKTPLAMINRAKETVSSVADAARDTAKSATDAVKNVPKIVKNVAEDVAFNAEYYSKQLKEGITGEKATKMAANIREEAKDWKRRAEQTKDSYSKNFFEQQYQKAEDFAKRFDDQAAKSLNGRVNSAVNSVKGMIDNARSSTAKAVNEAWDRIPKNSDGTVNPFDKNFQSTYNDWKTKKDKYDSSLAGRAKDAAEKATDSVKDMIDQAKRTAKDAAASAQSTIDNATGNNYRKRAQEANQAAENAINQRSRTNDQLENQRSKYGSKANDQDHIYGDSEGYYYKTKEQRDRAEALISKRDQYDADIVNNNRASKVNDDMYADSKAGKINDILGRSNVSTSERANSKATEVQNKWARQEAESKLIGGRLDPNVNVSKEYVYSRASNSGMAGQVQQVMQLEEAMRDAERAYDNLGNDSSKPHSSSRAARQKMLKAQEAYEKAYEELIADINKQYDRDLAAYEKQYGKYTR